MGALRTDLRHAWRALARTPGFTLTSLATLSLGLAGTAVMGAVVYGVLLRPLDYRDPDRLVSLDHAAPGIGAARGLEMTAGLYVYYSHNARSLARIAVYESRDVNLATETGPERVRASAATASLTATLGSTPVLGRWFADDPAEAATVVLSHDLWSRRFGADSSLIGRNVTIDGVSTRVIGVMPANFRFPDARTAAWLPMWIDPARTRLDGFSLRGIARLAPGASAASAQRELTTLMPGLIDAFPGPGSAMIVHEARLTPLVTPLRDALVGDVARTLWVLLASVALVLLIAVANVANLVVVRNEGRRRAVALRVALGARRIHLVRGALAESLLLVTGAAVVAFALSIAALGILRAIGPDSLPRLEALHGGPASAWIIAACAAVLTLALALAPMARRAHNLDALRESGRGSTSARRSARFRNVLAAAQVALAVVLLVAAGLMLRSFSRLRHVDPGFSAGNVLTFELGLPRNRYPTRELAVAAEDRILSAIRAIPGATTAGLTTCLPLCGSWSGSPWYTADHAPPKGTLPPVGATRRVSPGYLEALRVRLLRGRLLTADDERLRTGAAVISERLAERLWPGEDPIGRRLYYDVPPSDPRDWYHVVGVVANTPVRELSDDPVPMAFVPLLHADSTSGPGVWFVSVAVRVSVPPSTLVEPARTAIASVDRDLPMAHIRTLEAIVDRAASRTAFTMTLLVVAASVALLLGLVGTYGVLSHVVSRRASEFGIRMALGAQQRNILGIVLRYSFVVVGSGLLAGAFAALALTRFLRALLYGVSPGDPATFAVVVALIGAAGLAAALFPARRAVRIAPAEVLRAE